MTKLSRVVWQMSRATLELEPTVAARRALISLLEAATYSGKGMRTVGRRFGSRAVVVGTEGARRAGGAVHVLRGGLPARRRYAGRVVIAATAGGTAGAAAALAIRHGMALRRTSTNGKSAAYAPTAPTDPSEPMQTGGRDRG
jgi:hypothetical protein